MGGLPYCAGEDVKQQGNNTPNVVSVTELPWVGFEPTTHCVLGNTSSPLWLSFCSTFMGTYGILVFKINLLI